LKEKYIPDEVHPVTENIAYTKGARNFRLVSHEDKM